MDGSGFYHEMSTMCQKYLEPEQLDVSGDEELPNGVYKVERVISSRQRGKVGSKLLCSYTYIIILIIENRILSPMVWVQ